jgi:hypothetical protein
MSGGCSSLVPMSVPTWYRSLYQVGTEACINLVPKPVPTWYRSLYQLSTDGCTNLVPIPLPALCRSLNTPAAACPCACAGSPAVKTPQESACEPLRVSPAANCGTCFYGQGCRHRRKGKRLYKGTCLKSRKGQDCRTLSIFVTSAPPRQGWADTSMSGGLI